MQRFWPLPAALVLALAMAGPAAADDHALAMYGEPKYPAGFEHFDYVNPDAPRGGTLRLANTSAATFDSLNGFIVRGNPAAGLSYLYDTLTVASQDEPFTQYGLVAETIEVGPDRKWVRFGLDPEARFHDGEPITPEDVIFSFNTLREDGRPHFRYYYRNVASVEKTGEREVTFRFDGGTNRELPLIVGQLPVLPAHYWADRDFDRTTLEPPLGSGPYRLVEVAQGKRVVYERVDDYWAADHPVNRGHYNAERIRYDYYRDATVALEALKAGAYDLRVENIAKNWATAYDIDAVERGAMNKVEIPHSIPAGMQGFVFNTRRAPFDDRRVREALTHAFNFPWLNRNLFYGAYERTRSYFANSEMAATGLPSEAELELLEPLRDELPERVFTEAYTPPRPEEAGSMRGQFRKAVELLQAAGYGFNDDGRMVNRETGETLGFEILLYSPSFERVALSYADNLKRIGIKANVRTVDPAQYESRTESFDFDMIVDVFGQSNSPGNEQRQYWGCEAAETPGSRNTAGICSPAVDALVDHVIGAPDREALVTASRALDRALQWGIYVVPHWHYPRFRVVYWDRLDRPENNPPYGLALDTWWVDPGEAEALSDRLDR